MKTFARKSIFVALVGTLLVTSSPELSAQDVLPSTADTDTLRLEQLEQMALENNPTIREAAAAIRSVEGRKLQAGLYPNPILGYIGEEISARAPFKTSEHLLFLEQTIVTGRKLRKSRNIFSQAQVQAEADADAQKLRVLNAVRMLYYEAVGAQRLVELRRELSSITREAVEISEQLFNIGAADRPDVLAAEVEAQRAELDLIEAENLQEQVWRLLAAVVGQPTLEPTPLAPDLDREPPRLDQEKILQTLLQESPEMRRAQAGVALARAVLRRAQAEPIPDIFVRGGFGYNYERSEALRGRVGLEGFIEAGVRLPLFDRNQGNIAAARAEIERAERAVRRLQLGLRARLASTFARYTTAQRVVERYKSDVLPRAQQAYELYLAKFQQMAAAYPQVLIAQRTLFQVEIDYVVALVELWQNVVQIRGLLLMGGLNAPDAPSPDVTMEPAAMPSSVLP